MSLHDHIERLIANLQQAGATLQQARQALEQRRAAWSAPHPRHLQESADDLVALAERSSTLEKQRREILAAIGDHLAIRPLPGRELSLNVSRIAARLPRDLAARLRETAADTARQARQARLETMLGKRLLEHSRAAQEGVFQQLVGLAAARSAKSYDDKARVTGADPARAGNLIDGRV